MGRLGTGARGRTLRVARDGCREQGVPAQGTGRRRMDERIRANGRGGGMDARRVPRPGGRRLTVGLYLSGVDGAV